ncbi:hypothetical protein IAU60_003895 [Kwoniella sp. DSM 27419]
MGVPVFAAILVGLVSSLAQSLGLTIQRKSHIQDDALPLTSRRKPIRRPLWLLGFAIYITSNIFSTIFQLDALPIVILAPLGAVSLIFNALLARLMLGDKFGPTWLLGTALVAGGAVLIAVFGVVQEDEHGLDELLRLFRRGAFVAFFSVISVLTALVLFAAHAAAWHVHRQLGRIQLPSGQTTPISIVPSNYASPHTASTSIPFRPTRNARRRSSDHPPVDPAAPEDTKPPPSATSARAADAFKASNRSLHLDMPPAQVFPIPNASQQHTLTLCGLAFAAASGTLSGMCLVLAKAAVELLVITIDHFRTGRGQNEFARGQTWFLVGGLGVCAVLQLVYLNYSLTFAGPALICPLAFCFFNLSSIFDGLVFYDQFGLLKTYQIVLVSLGVAVLLLGVWVVSAVQPDAGVDVGTWVEDEEDGSVVCSPQHVDDEAEAGEGGGVVASVDPDDPLCPALDQATAHTQPRSPNPQDTPHGLFRSVFSPSSDLPTSPRLSTHSRSHSAQAHPRRHRTRYGSLIPDLPPGAPSGFSIGLGAASPGFALRSGSVDGEGHFHPHPHPHVYPGSNHSPGLVTSPRVEGGWHRRTRSRSEGITGLAAVERGDDPEAYERRTEDPGVIEGLQGSAGHSADDPEREGVTSHTRRRSLWDRLMGRTGRIKLADEDE